LIVFCDRTGITPMMSMLVNAIERRDDRPYLLIYANKSWENMTFREELDRLIDSIDLMIIYVLRQPSEDWTGETGYVDKALLQKYIPIHRGSRQYFICTAPVMMEQVEEALHDLQVPATNIQMEHFNLV
jgi:3-phenylpropionate/trans-cinnamate dioxygenase ferredoxin reductase subunit